MNIIIIKGQTQYDVLNFFIEALGREFEQLNHNVYRLDFKDDVQLQLQKAYRFNTDLIINMNPILAGEYETFFNNQTCVIWNFVVDHPMYHMNRLYSLWDNHITSFIDKNHVEYVKTYLPHLDNVLYMPHGGNESFQITNYKERAYDVVFMGSYTPPETCIQNISQFNDSMREIFFKTAERLHLGQEPFETILIDEFEKEKIHLHEDEIPFIIEESLFLDKYVRNINRLAMIEELAKNNIHVDVFGSGWNEYPNEYPDYIHIHPAINYDETIEIMSNSKIVLNNLPLFKNGSHERIFTSMLCGAVCVSEKNSYLETEFSENEDIIFFSYSELGKLPQKIKNLLEDPVFAESVATNGYNKAQLKHTWKHRAHQILDIYSKFKKEPSKKLLNVQDSIDSKFNQVVQFVESNSEEQIYQKIRANYTLLERNSYETLLKMENSYRNYPYWGKLSLDTKEFELIHQRAHQLKSHIDDFIWFYQKTQDATSKKILCNVLLHWITFKSRYLTSIQTSAYPQYFDKDLIQCTLDEVFVDVGAYTGDTLLSYLQNYQHYKKIICYEPDKNNYEKLLTVADSFDNIDARNNAVGSQHNELFEMNLEDARSESSRIISSNTSNAPHTDSIKMISLDKDIQDDITFIKMDAEGAESFILEGARHHISQNKPKLAVCIYHGNKDIWKLPKLIDSLNKDYQFFIRYYGGNLYPNEIVLYAI